MKTTSPRFAAGAGVEKVKRIMSTNTNSKARAGAQDPDLANALAYLAKHPGRFLFPLVVTDPKVRPKGKPAFKNNLALASNKPEQLKQWYAEHRQRGRVLWALSLKKSALVGIDVDCGLRKVGEESFRILVKSNRPLLNTEVVHSPSYTPERRSRHIIYQGEHHFDSSGSKLGKNIDLPNYVLIPGIKFDDGRAYVLARDVPAAQLPEWIAEKIKPSSAERRNAPAADPIPLDVFKKMLDATPYTGGPEGLDDRHSYGGWLLFAMDCHEAAGGDEADYLDAFIKWSLADPNPDWTQPTSPEYIERKWQSFVVDPVAAARTRASWLKLLDALGQTQFIGDANPAEADFGNEPEPEEPTGKDAERVKAGEREQAAERAAGKETWGSIKAGWVYVGQQGQFVRRSDGKMWDADKFEKQFGYVRLDLKDGAGNRPKSFTKFIFDLRPGAGLQTFDSFAFVPGQPENYKGDFNQWRKSDIEPKQGDTTLWDAHLAYLFADEAARNRVLNWMAWVYQNPTLHPNHSILVHGKIQGTGKTLLPRALAKTTGANPATPLSQHTLELDHNAWVLRTKLAIVDIRSSNKKLSDMLHDMITGELAHVDLKGAHDFDIPNVIAYWLETNKPDALAGLDNSDRRHLVETVDGESPLQPKPQAYYDALYPAILDDPVALAAIAYTLKIRDLKGYSGLHRAPSTEAKRAMMTAAADEVEKWMLEHRDEAPLCRSLVTINEVLGDMPTDVQHARVKGGARNRIAEVLTDHFNGESLGKVRLGGRNDLQPRLWAINKSDRAKSVRKTFNDNQLAQMFLNERWVPTPAELLAMKLGLAEAQREFAADPA